MHVILCSKKIHLILSSISPHLCGHRDGERVQERPGDTWADGWQATGMVSVQHH